MMKKWTVRILALIGVCTIAQCSFEVAAERGRKKVEQKKRVEDFKKAIDKL